MFAKLRLVLFTLILLTLSLTATAQRESAPSTLTLAQMTPAGVTVYLSTRTDAGFIETLDGLINRISEDAMGFPMKNMIAEALKEEGIRPWLGDSAAFFILPPTNIGSNPDDLYGLLVEITDRDAAVDYLDDMMTGDPILLPNGFIGFYGDGFSAVITENRLAIGKDALNTVPLLRGPTLAESPRFQQALAALPAGGDYPILAYVDPRSLITASAPEIFGDYQPVDVPALAESIGVFAAGMRQLDGQTYTFDIGWAKGQGSPFEALYLPDPNIPAPPALNVDFLNVVPADAQIVLHGAGLWTQFEANTRAAGSLSNALRTRLIQAGLWDMSVSNPMTYINAQWGSAFTELAARGTLNLTSEQLSAALDGDSVLALRASMVPDERVPRLMIEPGVWFASRDNGAADLLTGGVNLLGGFGVILTEQANGVGFELSDDMSGRSGGGLVIVPSDMVWLATDSLTYLGADSLTLENKQTLVAVPRITERIEPIRGFLLEGATMFGWVDVTGLKPLLDETDSYISVHDVLDSVFTSIRQTEQGMSARFAFRLK